MLKYFKLKYIFIFLICIWNPIQLFILKFDGAQRSIGILVILTFLVNIGNTNFMRSGFRTPVIYWGMWVIYAFINTLLIKYNFTIPYYTFFIILIVPFIVIWIITADNFDDRDILFNIIIIGLFIRMILIFLFDSGSMGDVKRLGSSMDSNDIASYALILIVFLYLKYLYEGFDLKILLLLILFPLYVIFTTASRNAFGGFIILLVSHFYIHRSKYIVSNFAIFLFVAVFIIVTLYFVSEKTYLGQRLSSTTEQGSRSDYDLNGTIFEKFGDRGIFYILGFELFKDHPIRGIGLGNFSTYQSHKMMMHSEVMTQLCELGIIGTILFLLFYGWIGKSLLRCRKEIVEDRKITEAYFSGFIIILFMGLSIFQYYNPAFFLLSGAMIAHVIYAKGKNKSKNL